MHSPIISLFFEKQGVFCQALYNVSASNLLRIENQSNHLPPNELVIQLTLKDVWLDYFKNKQNIVSRFVSGDEIYLRGKECVNCAGQVVLYFSRQFVKKIESLEYNGPRFSDRGLRW